MNPISRLWRRYRRLDGVTRELATFALCLLLGVLVIPAAIYLVGLKLLGSYSNGGYFAFVRDISVALGSFSWPFWLLALGPYLGVWLLRIWRRYAGQ
jgi:hypothetical protein